MTLLSQLPYQEVRPSLTEEDFHAAVKKKELDELRRKLMKEKGSIVIEI